MEMVEVRVDEQTDGVASSRSAEALSSRAEGFLHPPNTIDRLLSELYRPIYPKLPKNCIVVCDHGESLIRIHDVLCSCLRMSGLGPLPTSMRAYWTPRAANSLQRGLYDADGALTACDVVVRLPSRPFCHTQATRHSSSCSKKLSS